MEKVADQKLVDAHQYAVKQAKRYNITSKYLLLIIAHVFLIISQDKR